MDLATALKMVELGAAMSPAQRTELEQLLATEVRRLQDEVTVRDALLEDVADEPDTCLCEDCRASKLNDLRAALTVTS